MSRATFNVVVGTIINAPGLGEQEAKRMAYELRVRYGTGKGLVRVDKAGRT